MIYGVTVALKHVRLTFGFFNGIYCAHRHAAIVYCLMSVIRAVGEDPYKTKASPNPNLVITSLLITCPVLNHLFLLLVLFLFVHFFCVCAADAIKVFGFVAFNGRNTLHHRMCEPLRSLSPSNSIRYTS